MTSPENKTNTETNPGFLCADIHTTAHNVSFVHDCGIFISELTI